MVVVISIDEALNELSSSVDRLTATVQTFQAFLAYSQGETFLQKCLAEAEKNTILPTTRASIEKPLSYGIVTLAPGDDPIIK